MSQLPAGWIFSTIGEVAEVNPRMSKASLDDDQPVTFVPMASVSVESGEIDVSDVQPSGPLKKKSFRQFAEGDVLVAKITPSMENGKGAVARGLASGRGFGSTEFHVLRPSTVIPEYLLNFMLQPSFRADAASKMTGTAGQLRVSPGYLRDHLIPLPPLPEQLRIVAAIEEYFSLLDTAEANLLRCATRVKHLERTAGALGIHAAGPTVPLSKVLLPQDGKVLRQGWSPKCLKRPSADLETWGVLKTSAVHMRKFNGSANKELPTDLEPRPHLEVHDGDLIMTSGGPRSRIGVTCIARSPRPHLMLCDKMFRFRADPTRMDSEYLLLYLTGPDGLAELEKIKTGSNDSGLRISQRAFENLPIPVPSLEVQRAIVKQATEFSDQADVARKALDSSVRRSSALRRSVLAAAFSGDLVPQDPSDEPASVFLERIAAERHTAKPSHKKKASK